jgi:hypothetical protein
MLGPYIFSATMGAVDDGFPAQGHIPLSLPMHGPQVPVEDAQVTTREEPNNTASNALQD